MRNLFTQLFTAAALATLPGTSASAKDTTDLAAYVNPFIGTSGTGHTFPGAATPLGLVQLSPETGNYKWEYCSGYQYADTTVRGFSHTHLNGTGVGNLGDVLILPFKNGTPKRDFAVPFSKNEEIASPGYYSSLLSTDEIKVELTATPHTGAHRYTFLKDGEQKVLINIDSTLFSWGDKTKSKVTAAEFEVKNPQLITGFLRNQFWVEEQERQVYFAIKLGQAFKGKSFADDAKRLLVLDYDAKTGEPLELRVGISTVSVEGAMKNLAAESDGKSFDDLHLAARASWTQLLSKIAIQGTDDQKTNFYTALYHLYLQPSNIADVDGRYRGFLNKVSSSPMGVYYSTLSIWDTFRAAHPLYNILSPEKNAQFVESMLLHAEAKGALPIWGLWGGDSYCMIGNHGVSVVAEAWLKGIPGIDGARAYAVVKKSLTTSNWEKYTKWDLYDKYQYLPADLDPKESVSKTLESGYNDWCAAQMAKKLGKMDDYEFFMKRASYYKNLYDPETGLMRGRNSDGSWVTPFDPLLIAHGVTGGNYTEGNAWQYSFHVLQDAPGLMALMGGKDAFAAKLDTLFTLKETSKESIGFALDVSGLIGQYAHGNEPSHHVAYLYNYAGQPHKAQKYIREVLATQYLNKPDGLSGNDDCGQMSAWLIFSTLGFYPVNPASGIYDIGIPSYESASIHVGNGRTFEIRTNGQSNGNVCVQSVTLNGEPITNYQIRHEQIMKGGVLEFTLAPAPVK